MGLVPRYLDSAFKFVHETHNRQTRAADNKLFVFFFFAAILSKELFDTQ